VRRVRRERERERREKRRGKRKRFGTTQGAYFKDDDGRGLREEEAQRALLH